MDTLHITTPADLVSLIGHSLGYWPHESLVCISLQDSRMGATLRLDLPTTPDHAHTYARKVGGYRRSDQDATAAVFAIFTDATRDNDSEALFGPLVESLAQQFALAGMPIQAGWIVGPTTMAEFRIHPVSYGPDIPASTWASLPRPSWRRARRRRIAAGTGSPTKMPPLKCRTNTHPAESRTRCRTFDENLQ